MKLCAIIPSYNHATLIADIVAMLRQVQLPVFIIDDASDAPAQQSLAVLHTPERGVIVTRLEKNQGKGGAVLAGFGLAIAAGYTHALQVDADGQHDLSALPTLIDAAKQHPLALISGKPIYDASIPKGRKIGRWITHVWVWVETLSFRITDSMCGFRVYPLGAVEKLLSKTSLGRRMDFDGEIMVRLFWQGVDVVMVPVRVMYPQGNSSNFDMLRDNLRISKMHAKLVCTMLLQLPSILAHRPAKGGNHWSAVRESGAAWGVVFCVTAYKLMDRAGCRIVLMPIVFYFYITGKKQRHASANFLSKALGRTPSFVEGYQHFLNFACRGLDTLGAWSGRITSDAISEVNPEIVAAMASETKGALIVVAHMGNVELARALLAPELRERMVVLTHTRHAENYNKVLCKHYPDAALNLIQVTEIGPETMITLQQHIEQGSWISIAGDRTAVLSSGHVSRAPFLGVDAPFAHGPWIMASLLSCPVYLLFCLPENGHYNLIVERFSERILLPRGGRTEALQRYTSDYAKRLEHYAKQSPFQWFNFFNFWDDSYARD